MTSFINQINQALNGTETKEQTTKLDAIIKEIKNQPFIKELEANDKGKFTETVKHLESLANYLVTGSINDISIHCYNILDALNFVITKKLAELIEYKDEYFVKHGFTAKQFKKIDHVIVLEDEKSNTEQKIENLEQTANAISDVLKNIAPNASATIQEQTSVQEPPFVEPVDAIAFNPNTVLQRPMENTSIFGQQIQQQPQVQQPVQPQVHPLTCFAIMDPNYSTAFNISDVNEVNRITDRLNAIFRNADVMQKLGQYPVKHMYFGMTEYVPGKFFTVSSIDRETNTIVYITANDGGGVNIGIRNIGQYNQ